MALVIHRMRVRCGFNRCLRAANCVVHHLLRRDAHAFRLLPEVWSHRMVLMVHHLVVLRNHGHRAAFADLRLVLVRALKQLQAVADLRLVEAIRIVGWRGRPSDRLLAGSLARLIRRIVRALRLIESSLFIVIRLNATWLARVRLWYVSSPILLVERLLHH